MDTPEYIQVKFWGVRGSHPTPGAGTVNVGGNTACVEICAGGHIIILDAGTGIIPLGQDLLRRSAGRPLNLTLLFSHMHHDHTQGFPFFAPAFVPSTCMHIFGPHTFQRELDQVLAQNMVPPVFPVTLQDMGASKYIQAVSETQVILLDKEGAPHLVPAGSTEAENAPDDFVRIRVLKSAAHPGGVMIYRVEYRGQSLVYATDTEGYVHVDRRLAQFAHHTGLLIHDAQYLEDHYLGLNGWRSTQGWGHSTAAMACDLAAGAGAGGLALFHHDPVYDDGRIAQIEAVARARFSGTFAAREGMEISISSGELARPAWNSLAV